MIPKFLRPEVFPFASVDIIPVPPPAAELEPADDEADDDREELFGSTCGANCGYCGRCS